MEKFQDYEEFINLLNKHKVEYLIIGGHAVVFYSRPRLTEDLDIWINGTIENSKKIYKAVREFWHGELDIRPEDFMDKELIFQMGYAPVRIDILTSAEGLDFEKAFAKSNKGLFYGTVEANYLDKESLIINKTLAGRRKDIEAIKWMEDSTKKKDRK